MKVSSISRTRANQEFPRSESSFVAVLGWYSTPGYLLCEHEPIIEGLIFDERVKPIRSSFHPTHLGLGPIRVVGLAYHHDASDIPFLRSHGSQKASIAAADLQLTLHSSPLS